MEKWDVDCEVGTESLNITVTNFSLQLFNPKQL